MAECFRLSPLYVASSSNIVTAADGGSRAHAYALVPDPSVTDLTTCRFVVESGSSPNAWRELGNMSTENAFTLGAAVIAVWAVAWGFKVLRSVVFSSYGASSNE